MATELPDDEKIVISNPEYLDKVGGILTGTEPETLRNYMMWMLVSTALPSLNQAARNVAFGFTRATKGVREPPPLWKDCVRAVSFLF